MALNIPVNLMNTVTPLSQPPTAVGTEPSVAPIQPASGSADTRNNASDDSGARSSEQQALLSKRMPSTGTADTPNRAEATSIVTAQVTPKGDPSKQEQPAQTPKQASARQSEIDRYAPPDPLPTAPILQAAASYAAKSEPL